jgi:hypothetical protein
MTRSQGKEYLSQTLKPLVPSDSLDMVIEYLCSYDPFNKEEMLIFLEDVSRDRSVVNAILEKYIQLCNQLDSNSVIFTPKEFQGKTEHKKVQKMTQTNSTPAGSTLQPRQQQQQTSSQPTPQPQQQQIKKNQPPSHNELISFAGEKTSHQEAKTHKKQPTNRSNRNEKTKKSSHVSVKSLDRHHCGCFATHHDFYTSCLSCGRIHCILEGPGGCLFCSSDLVPPLPAEIANVTLGYREDNEIVRGAYRQKDKLLTFDKEHAKRTQVHDAQVRFLLLFTLESRTHSREIIMKLGPGSHKKKKIKSISKRRKD